MAYTTIDKPSDYFTTKLFTGNGGTNAITGVGFQPDWIWFKNRTSAQSHAIVDSVRGREGLQSNVDEADYTLNSGKDFGTFDSDGFTVLTPEQLNSFNYNTGSIVAWNWKAGTSFTNDASSTSIGSIDSAGSVSDISGFSIVSFTGTGSNGTIKHGLSTAPNLFIIKRLDADNDWRVGSSALTNFVKHVNLNTTAVESDLAAAFNSTGPTTSVFSVGTSVSTNADGGTYIAYCFSSIKGYSKVGSYTGNGSTDGTFSFTGFKVGWLMVKRTDSANSWIIMDNKRTTFNPMGEELKAEVSDAGNVATRWDQLSNGFKLRNAGGAVNASGGTYIYMAFAENPFVTSTGVPATAR